MISLALYTVIGSQPSRIGRQVWLSDLASSNDANEVVYGFSRVFSEIDRIRSHWRNTSHATTVRQIASNAIQRFNAAFHVYAFCLSEERDMAQHWDGYGGGLQTMPEPDDPYVAIGFDAQSFFYPIELSTDEPQTYVINTVHGDDDADHLIQYWAIKARKVLERLDTAPGPLSRDRAFDALERMLVLTCSLIKNNGWRDLHEYRLIYIADSFGEDDDVLPQSPTGMGGGMCQ